MSQVDRYSLLIDLFHLDLAMLPQNFQTDQCPPPPGTDEPDLPSRPAPIAGRISDLSNRTVPTSPNAGRKLPGIPVMKNHFFDISKRQIPALPTEGPQDDLPSRPPPPKPTQSMPELPPRPGPSSPIKQLSLDSLSTRPVPPPPGSNDRTEAPVQAQA